MREAVANGIEAVAVPGPTAMASALSVSGMEIEEFTFYGFLPRQKKELTEKLLYMAGRSRIAVAHESPHRVEELLSAVKETLPHTLVSASCDLTKRFERTLRGPVDRVLEQIQNNPKAEKGEYCLCFQWAAEDIPAPRAPQSDVSLEARLLDELLTGASLRDAQTKLMEAGERKNAVYAAALRLKGMLKEE